MNPKLKHLEAVVRATRGRGKLIRVIGGIEGAPIVRVDCGDYTLIGPMAALEVEDRPDAQAQAQDPQKEAG
jgi:hypothetical protein